MIQKLFKPDRAHQSSSNQTQKSPRIRALILAVFALAVSGLSLLNRPTLAANPLCSQPNVSEEVKRANGCSSDAPELQNVVIGIINGFVGALGLVAVIFIVVGGVNYMTSAGDSGKLQKAKNTILYAVIGLVICVLAFAIVNFVIVNILNNNSGEESGEESRASSSIISSNVL